METLANLESFVRSAESGGFSTAARRLSLTPAAVSRNVAMLERNLGVRLFHRSTRKLTLTEAGERFLHAIRDNLEELQASIASVATDRGEPAGVLKVSLGLTFGVDYILPLLPKFLKRYPNVRPDWQFKSRQVDLIAEGFDAAIGGGLELAPGVVSRTLAPLHIVAVTSPGYLKGRMPPADPSGLAAFDDTDPCQDAGFRRLRRRGVPASTSGRTICRQCRLASALTLLLAQELRGRHSNWEAVNGDKKESQEQGKAQENPRHKGGHAQKD